jgi:hypothetical protein
MPRLCEFYPGICITTEEKSRKNLSQGKKNLSQVKKNLSHSTVYILPKVYILPNYHMWQCSSPICNFFSIVLVHRIVYALLPVTANCYISLKLFIILVIHFFKALYLRLYNFESKNDMEKILKKLLVT